MKQFFFVIRNNKIDYIDFGVIANVNEYIQFYDAANREKVEYKIINGEVSNMICQADCITTAISAVQRFLCFQKITKLA